MDRRIAAALVSVLVVGVTSCGSAGPKLTRDQLVSKVEVACREAAQTVEREMRAGGGASPTPVQYGAAAVAGERVLDGRLKGLNASAADRRDFESFRTGIRRRLAGYERMESALRSAQKPSSVVVREDGVLFRRLDALAKRLGFAGCI